MNTKHDIFISYRRDGGETIAHHLYTYFRDDGYNPFFDFESLRAGKFNEQIYDAIDECKFFLLILPSAALDRCVNDGDWVRLEIAHAIKQKKIIIPIMLRGFVWPAILPEDIADVRYCQGVEVTDRLLFEGLYNELSKLIDVHFDRKRNKHGRSKWTRQRNSQIISIIADGAVCVAAIIFLLVLDVWLIGKYLGIEELIFSSGFAWLDAFFLQASFAEILLLWIVASIVGVRFLFECGKNGEKRQCANVQSHENFSLYEATQTRNNLSLESLTLTIEQLQSLLLEEFDESLVMIPANQGTDCMFTCKTNGGVLRLYASNAQSPVNRLCYEMSDRSYKHREDSMLSILRLHSACTKQFASVVLLHQGFKYVRKAGMVHRFEKEKCVVNLLCCLGVVQEIEITMNDPDEQTPVMKSAPKLRFILRNILKSRYSNAYHGGVWAIKCQLLILLLIADMHMFPLVQTEIQNWLQRLIQLRQ